jgi:hypothetical protein
MTARMDKLLTLEGVRRACRPSMRMKKGDSG